MNRFLLGLAVVGLVSLPLSPLFADKSAEDIDFTQPQSPAKPTPKWVKIIDQGKNDAALRGYFTPEGLRVEIVADYPTVMNPVGMTFSDDGTLYVLEWLPDEGANFPEYPVTFTYKDGSTRQVATMKKRVKDVVKVLRDTKGKGVYDEAKVLLEDELPSSILVHDGWLYLSGRGTVRRYRLADLNDKKAAKAEVIAQGFCGFHHHQVSGLTIGNDGWLYITSGDDDNYVEGSDGSRATVLRTGAVFRCRPDGSKMHVYSLGYRNPYRDLAFDTEGNFFHADNDNEDGSKFTGCRLMHVAEGSDFGWRLRIGSRCCVPDHVRGAVFGELPGKLPPLLKTGRGAPAGLLIYNDSRLPDQYRGLLLYPDAFRQLIRAYKVEPKGASFQVTEEFELMKSQDPLFRPCQMVLGPDGAIYVCDWRTNSGGAGRLWGDGKHGRIYRIRWGGMKDEGFESPAIPLRGMDSWAKIAKLSDEELLKTLASEEFSDRLHAQRELVRRGDKQRPTLLKLLADTDQSMPARIAALGALQSFWNAAVQEAFVQLLEDKEPDLRRLAADGLALNAKPGDKKVHAGLLQTLGDSNRAVRRAAALAMAQVGTEATADNLANALSFDDGKDVYLRDGLVRAIERLGKPGIERLLALAESGAEKDLDAAVDAFLALRTRPGAEAVVTLLKNPHLSIAQRAGLLRSYNNYLLDPPVSLDAALAYLVANPDEVLQVKLAGLEVLSSAGALKGEKAQGWLLGLLDDPDPGLRLSVIKAVEDTRLAKAAPRLVKLLGDKSRSVAERTAATRALRVLDDKSAVPVLKDILAPNQALTPELAAWHREALRTLAALDPDTAQEPAKRYLEKPSSQVEAVAVLGTRPDGAKHVGKLFLDKKLPRELLPQVSEALRKHADKDKELARMLTEVMASGLLLTNSPAEVERVRELVRKKGDPRRGRAVYLDHKTVACIKCHSLEGVGGGPGPDLTRTWETQSLEKIMEALIEPSKEIKEGYQSYTVTTKKGQTLTGLKVVQNADEVVLRDANGQLVRVAAKDVEEVTASKQSLMPDNVLAQLSYDQFIDLVAFLKDRAAQESLRGLALEFWVVGPFGDDLKAEYPPEAKPDHAATYPGGKQGETLAWQAVQAEPNGYLNLRSVFQRDRVSAYALAYVYSPQSQKAQMLLGADDTVRVWLNGKMVHEHGTPRLARPDDDRVEVALNKGWNKVLLKVVNVQAEHGLYLRFTGSDGLRVGLRPSSE